ncbi:FYVE, RhoGEF and PH domain-containing protein 5-like [Morone saxatilis]|uniref:FYVE, RhoGEF and PH domain-containing protein 5-like n=1 Tax=Morone saxatilis TaxID=34816 RepID=UPI0015E1E2D4|nr:FYVE, RhoGEF and PH domain-containing protein 5-like [Morone saxatilis]
MNTDCTKPSVAPKPRFVCHASLKLPSPLMSAARGPKPSIAPKPKVTRELNGNQGGCFNGGLLTSGGEVDEEHETENGLNKVVAELLPAGKQFNAYILKSPQKDVKTVAADGEVTEEVKEEEEDMVKKMDEDWRLTDSALTEEVDSVWVSDAGLTADSEEAVEMVDTDTTEDMDAEGCDAGEALADPDGLSVGDISVNSIDKEAGCFSAENRHMNESEEKLQIKQDETSDCTADDLTESLTDELGLLSNDTAKQVVLTDGEEKEEESALDCGITCNILKFRCGHKIKEKGKNLQNISFSDFISKDQKQICERHVAIEDDPTPEPYYVSSEDIINREIMPRNNPAEGLPESPLIPQKLMSINSSGVSTGIYEETPENGQSSEDYVEIGNNGYSSHYRVENKARTYQKRTTVKTEELKAQTAEALLNHLDCQPRFRLVSISVPTDTDTSLTSSLSESQLLSPNDSDVFRDEEDLEGHIVPFLDDTTDTEQDISDEHVYEEPGHSSEGENVFPFDKRTTERRARSLSHRFNNNVADMGMQFVQRPYMSGFGQPALSSSPMLSSMLHKTHAKPHYLSLYPRSLSMEGQDTPLGAYSYREGSPRQGGAICSSGSFSRCSPLSSSGLSTPTSVVDIPPPFDLAYITKRPITKSSPSLFMEGDSSEKNRKKKSSIKRFLMLKFRRKTESKSVVDVNPSSFKSSAESSHHMPSRLLDLDRHSLSSSPHLNSRSAFKPHVSPELASKFLLYNDSKRKGSSMAFLNRSVVRVESFEDRSRVPFTPLPLTKPRSISFPNANTSDYENVPAISSDYENLQVPQRRPVRQTPFTGFFDRPSRALSSANDTDGYVDMSSLPGFRSTTQTSEQETESAYTEAYNVCSVAVAPQTVSVGDAGGETAGEDDQGRTSEEEDGVADNYDRQPDGRSRAFYIAKELVDTERLHVKALKLLQEDFREAVGAAVGDEGEPVLDEERLREILNELPDIYTLHRRILNELENRIRHWEESQRIADIFLSRKAEFLVFTTYIGHYDRSMSLLEDSCRTSPAFAAIVHQFEQESPAGEKVSLKHQLLQVIVRVAQYRMLLTDYLNNLSPDSKEYEDTQAAVAVVSDIADQANDSIKHGENLLRLVNIEYSVRGQRDLLQPGRVFVKEGTLMKVSRKSRQPRHLFLVNTASYRNGKVCDHCYSELKKRGGDMSALSGKSSPRPNRSSRPLSAVFQNIHPPNIWRHRKGTASFTQVTMLEEGSISGSLQRSKKSKRSWKRLWFLLKDKVLYTYRAQEEKVASESLPLLGFTVKLPDKREGEEEEASIFQLYHKNTLYYTFKAVDNYTAQRWVNAMEEATVL